MIRRATSEIKIIGINFFIISAAFTSALIVLSVIAGELLNFYPVSFEVMFPFFVTIAVGEWGKTRADSNFDMIAAQSNSLFHWVLLRYVITFGISSLFAIFCMMLSSAFRYELPLWELLIIYLPPAFFLGWALVGLVRPCMLPSQIKLPHPKKLSKTKPSASYLSSVSSEASWST